MIGNVQQEEAVTVVAANHWVGQVHVLDLGLQLSTMVLANPADEDDCNLVGLSDGAICVEEPFTDIVQCRAATEDELSQRSTCEKNSRC